MSTMPWASRADAEAWQANPQVHPLTCNGGNPDWRTHHDHEVLLVPTDEGLHCPECGRLQPYAP